MGKIETELSKLYDRAEAEMLVRNQDEFAKALKISRATLHRYNKFPDKVPVEVLNRAKEFVETKNVSGAIVINGSFADMVGQRLATTAVGEAMIRVLRARLIRLEATVSGRDFAEIALEFDRTAEAELMHILQKMKNSPVKE